MAVALSEADVAGMLEVLHEAAVVDGPDAFTEPVVEALVRLLPADGGACCNVFAGRDPRIPGDRLTVVDFASAGAEWIRQGSALWRIPRIPPDRLTVVDFTSVGAEWIRQGPTLWRGGGTGGGRPFRAPGGAGAPQTPPMLLAGPPSDKLLPPPMR